MTSSRRTIRLPDSFLEAVFEQSRVTGMPHEIYRYPARFSPRFAREAILSFTDTGDFVLDPFCGGGTTISEAIALGRRAAGIDINALATFLNRTKTTPLSLHDIRAIRSWAKRLSSAGAVKMVAKGRFDSGVAPVKHLTHGTHAFFNSVLYRINKLARRRQQEFVRLVLLATGQAALDCKTTLPSSNDLLAAFRGKLELALVGFTEYWREAAQAQSVPPCRLTRFRRVLNRSCAGCGDDGRIPPKWLPAKLVLTSPPYPGVHVLYHRWQILGRRETSAAFWIANQNDGAGESHYTFGPRQQPGLATYFRNLRTTFSSARRLLGERSLVVQLVGFSAPDWQLPNYLAGMKEAGFEELLPDCDRTAMFQRRVWRNVPSRRWYACLEPKISSSQEVLLLHRPV